MAGQIQVETIIQITDPTGKKLAPLRYSYVKALTAITIMDFAVTADQTRIIWDPVTGATENVADFDTAIFVSDGVLDLEGTVDVGDEVGNEAQTVRLVDGLPYMLGADDAFANVTGVDALGTGTLDVIEKWRVDEPAGAARNLKLILAT